MQIVIQALGAATVVGGITIGILLYYHKQTPAVWVTFATFISLALVFCLNWQVSVWSKQKEFSNGEIEPQPKAFQPKEPRFSESIDTFFFSLGERGISVGYKKEVLEKTHMKNLYVLNDYRPVELYIENGQLYADVKIYGGRGLPPIEIKKNKVSNKPDNWDLNSNENAMEIVNQDGIPIYQFLYKTPSHIVMNGIFPYPGGFILANKGGAILNPELPTTFILKRIFKYPSWKYPGEYEE